MKKQLTFLLVFLYVFAPAIAQNNAINASNDTTISCGTAVILHANINVLPNVSTNGISLQDDVFSSIINLGFTFNFYGNNYTQCLISTNGYITFNTSFAGGASPWSINNPIPDPTPATTTNAIMGPWQDVQPASGGTIQYASFGIAPNRKFVVQWDNPMFSCTDQCFGNQIILYENGSFAETHIGNKPLCTTWNGGQAIHGVQNATGTLASVVPGRNANMQWTAQLEGKRFSPSGANYTIADIPFNPIFLGVANNSIITWSVLGGGVLAQGANITVTPMITTTYIATVSSVTCGGTLQSSSFAYYDTVKVTVPTPTVTTIVQQVNCQTSSGGNIVAVATNAVLPLNFSWNTVPPTINDTLQNVAAGTYTVTLTDSFGCVATQTATITALATLSTSIVSTTNILCNGIPTGNIELSAASTASPLIYVLNNDTSLNGVFSNLAAGTYNVNIMDALGCAAIQTVALTQPANPLVLQTTAQTNVSCFGLSNGAITIAASGGTQPYNYSNGNTNNSTGVFNAIPASAYTLAVTDANGCYVILKDTIHQPNQLVASIASSSNVLCKEESNGSATAQVVGGTAPYTYNWNTNPIQNTAIASNLPIGNYALNISDNNGCTTSTEVTLTEPDALAITASNDLFVCETYEAMLNAHATGGEGVITYLWMPGALQYDSITIAPTTNTIYTVTATDANGCSISEPVDVTVYASPEPIIMANTLQGCETLCPTFTDLTTDPTGSINVTREWTFGDGGIAKNKTTLDYCYKKAGKYDVTLTVITDKGCPKTTTWNQYIEVYPLPEANFTTDPTVTDILKPFVYVNNNSTGGDVYTWNYGDSDSLFLGTSSNHHTYRDTGLYSIYLVAKSNKGCIDSAKSFVRITPYYSMFLPSSFTPNGDGLNDVFEIKGSYMQACNLEIFDRWGQLMYNHSGSTNVFWDGANAPQGVYVYKLQMKDTQNKEYEYIGQITVLR